MAGPSGRTAGSAVHRHCGWAGGSGLTPNFLWPADESWCLGTNVDLDSSILGAPSRILSEVEALPELETFRVAPSTDLTSSFPARPLTQCIQKLKNPCKLWS